MEQIKAFIELIRAAFGPQIMAILGLTLCQVILAVAVSVKNGNFELKKLADFFQTLILPKLLGWLACAILVQFVLADYLPSQLGPAIASTAFLALVASFVGAILQNLQELGIIPQQVQGVMKALGIKTAELPS